MAVTSSNPMLKEEFFRPQTAAPRSTIDARADQAAWGGAGVPGTSDHRMNPYVDTTTRTMTMGGTVSATGLLLLLILVGAIFGWAQVTVTTATDLIGRSISSVQLPTGLLIGSIIGAFVCVIITRFKPVTAMFLGVPYALAEGVALGMISHAYDVQSKGIAIEAVLATLGVFTLMLVLYGLRVLRATPKFVKGVIAATGGICLMYVFAIVMQLFGHAPSFLHSGSPLSIGLSVVIVAIAAFNLIIDFDFIERGSQQGLPKHMEWYAAIGLVVTIVWLYLELLRLLSNLNRR